MPIYEYECSSCGHGYERRYESSNDRDIAPPCPKCGATDAKRLFSSFSVNRLQSLGGGKTCCGASDPGAGGCSAPGSCCGKGE
ncbi:MAG: zinc ribbon domain-containing protein [bacterium]